MDIRPDADKANVVIYGTPGLAQLVSKTTGNGLPAFSFYRGLLAGVEVFYTLSSHPQTANTLFLACKIETDGSFTTQSLNLPFASSSSLMSMSQNGTQIIAVDGISGQIITTYDDITTPIANVVIAAAGFPNGCKTVTFLSGFFIAERPNSNQFFISGSYDGTAWSALDFATAEQDPDIIKAVDSDHGMLITFGAKHIEWWGISGALDFPFAPIQSATQEYGLAAVFSRAHVSNTIAFLASNPQGQVQVRWFQGYSAVVISTTDIDSIINNFNTFDDAEALSYVTNGHEMYQLTFPTENRSFLFDCTTQIWSEVQSSSITSVSFPGGGTALSSFPLTGRHLGRLSMAYHGESYMAGSDAFPFLYLVDDNKYTDDGRAIKRLVQTRHLIEEGNVFGIDEIFLDMETGVGLQTGQGSNPQVMMQISRDGGRTFGPERWVPIGMVGQYRGPRAIWRRNGSGRDLSFRFAMTDPVKFVVTYGAASLRERPQ